MIPLVFVPERQLTDKLIAGESDKETARKSALGALIQLMAEAKLLSQMNPLTGLCVSRFPFRGNPG
jgi:hypothetical protein